MYILFFYTAIQGIMFIKLDALLKKHHNYFFFDFLITELGFTRWFPETHKNTTSHDVR